MYSYMLYLLEVGCVLSMEEFMNTLILICPAHFLLKQKQNTRDFDDVNDFHP